MNRSPAMSMPSHEKGSDPEALISTSGAALHSHAEQLRCQRETLETLESQLCAQGNMHALFLATYAVSMRKCEMLVAAARDAGHPAHAEYAALDADLVERIASEFFRLYIEAFGRDRQNAGRALSTPWDIAFSLSSMPHASPAQGILSGLIAHSCYDLPIVLATCCEDLGRVYDPDDSRQRATYESISRLLTEELGVIADRIHRTLGAMRLPNRRRPVCHFVWLQRIAGRPLIAWIADSMLRALHNEAANLAIRLQRGEMTRSRLAVIVNSRLRAIHGRGLLWRLPWLIVRSHFAPSCPDGAVTRPRQA